MVEEKVCCVCRYRFGRRYRTCWFEVGICDYDDILVSVASFLKTVQWYSSQWSRGVQLLEKLEFCAYCGILDYLVRNFGSRWLCVQHRQPCEARKTRISAYLICDAGRGFLQLVDGVIAKGCAVWAVVWRQLIILHQCGSVVWEHRCCWRWTRICCGRSGNVPCGSRYHSLVRVRSPLVWVAETTAEIQRYHRLSICAWVCVCQ